MDQLSGHRTLQSQMAGAIWRVMRLRRHRPAEWTQRAASGKVPTGIPGHRPDARWRRHRHEAGRLPVAPHGRCVVSTHGDAICPPWHVGALHCMPSQRTASCTFLRAYWPHNCEEDGRRTDGRRVQRIAAPAAAGAGGDRPAALVRREICAVSGKGTLGRPRAHVRRGEADCPSIV